MRGTFIIQFGYKLKTGSNCSHFGHGLIHHIVIIQERNAILYLWSDVSRVHRRDEFPEEVIEFAAFDESIPYRQTIRNQR